MNTHAFIPLVGVEANVISTCFTARNGAEAAVDSHGREVLQAEL